MLGEMELTVIISLKPSRLVALKLQGSFPASCQNEYYRLGTLAREVVMIDAS